MEGVVDRFCKRTCDKFSLFDRKITVDKLIGLTLLNENLPHFPVDDDASQTEEDSHENGTAVNKRHTASTVKYFCPLCSVKFQDERRMRDHYKTEWHLYNLNLNRHGLRKISQSEFEEDNLDFSSSESDSSSSHYNSACESGDEHFIDANDKIVPNAEDSHEQKFPPNQKFPNEECDIESDSDENIDLGELSSVIEDAVNEKSEISELKLPHFNEASGLHKIFFRNKNGEIIALYRSLLYNKQNRPDNVQELLRRVNHLRECKKWAVLLYSGGCFAGGIFNERDEVVHKTFKRYTVRKKQGGRQSAQDAKGNAPKSAGASLRRYGERAIRQEINDLLHSTWKDEMLSCDLILYWTPKSQRRVLFPSSNFSLSNSTSKLTFTIHDERLRSIPLIVRDVTYNQVKVLHTEMSTYEVYDAGADLTFLQQNATKQLRKLSENGGNILQESLSGRLKLTSCSAEPDCLEPSSVNQPDEEENESGEQKSNQISNRKMNKKKSRHNKNVSRFRVDAESSNQQEEQLSPQDIENNSWRDRFLVAVACGDNETCDSLIQSKLSSFECQSSNEDSKSISDKMSDLLCQPLGGGYTLLHIASQSSSPEVIRLLLQHGCDPIIKGYDGSTAYHKACNTGNKSLTQVYRRFRFDNPDKYDYDKAQIPPALNPEIEAQKKARDAERRKIAAKQKKEREKVKRAEEKLQREELEERNKFLNLSDREKRALALERRLLSQAKESNQQLPVFSRCFQCAVDISGKVPFEYKEYRFCSTSCVRTHRTKSDTK